MILGANVKNIDLIKTKFKNGEVVIFPTDTVFGIGCIASNNMAIERIYSLKERDKNKSLLLNFANIRQVENFAYLDEKVTFLIEQFMPGPLSIILKVKPGTSLSNYVINDNKIGIRIPNNKVLLDIISSINYPIVSTSCNKSGFLPAINAQEAEKIFGKDITILKEEKCTDNISSTIIDMSESKVKYIREGVIKFEEIKNILN